MKSLYLLIDLCTVSVPVLFSFHPKLNFYKNWKPFFISNAIIAVVFIIWDVLFTHLGVWGFNPDYILGIYFFNLPLEEILFFICIPYACVFTYHCLNLFFKISWSVKTTNSIVYSLAILLFVFGIYFSNKLYPAYTFISLALSLFIIQYLFKVNWLGKLLSIYPILLIPFFIVNGILTGSGLQQPVVWYDDAENMRIRLLTIPFEDIFYGFELILLNILLYEYFLRKRLNKQTGEK